MSLTTIINLCFSVLFFIISFSLSIRYNLFLEALYRSSIVFICSSIFIYLLISLFKQLREFNEAKLQEPSESPESLEVSTEPLKGENIDLKTPEDDDSEFKPLQPRKLNKQDD